MVERFAELGGRGVSLVMGKGGEGGRGYQLRHVLDLFEVEPDVFLSRRWGESHEGYSAEPGGFAEWPDKEARSGGVSDCGAGGDREWLTSRNQSLLVPFGALLRLARR